MNVTDTRREESHPCLRTDSSSMRALPPELRPHADAHLTGLFCPDCAATRETSRGGAARRRVQETYCTHTIDRRTQHERSRSLRGGRLVASPYRCPRVGAEGRKGLLRRYRRLPQQ